MARLPIPGKDAGTWGDILNDYLSQAHQADGALKDDAVTSNALAPNSVTTAAIASNAVTAASIADGSITEALLDSAVQSKLNQADPTWTTINGKPAVVAEGSSAIEARRAIEAGLPSTALHTSFGDKLDGPCPARGDDGVAVTTRGVTPELDNRMVVRDGLLQAPEMAGGADDRAAYWNQPLDGVKRIGASFKIASGATDPNGAMTLALWEYAIPEPYAVPNSPMHLSVCSRFWQLGIWEGGDQSASGTFTVLRTAFFDQPLADDWNPGMKGTGTTHRIEVVIENDTVTLALPDGSTATVSDGRIASVPISVACFEIYRDATDSAATAFEEIWAGADLGPTGSTSLSETARALQRIADGMPTALLPKCIWHAPASPAYVSVPTTLTNIAGLPSITITLPANCTALEIEATLYYSITASARIIVGFVEGSTLYAVRSVVEATSYAGIVSYTGVREGIYPGSTHTITLQHMVVGSGAVLNLDAPNGYVASIKATPVITVS